VVVPAEHPYSQLFAGVCSSSSGVLNSGNNRSGTALRVPPRNPTVSSAMMIRESEDSKFFSKIFW